MAFLKTNIKTNSRETLKSELMTARRSEMSKPDPSYFYEMEAAVVIDVIRDESHPVFTENVDAPKIERSTWPDGYNDPSILDYSWIGRVRVRMINSQQRTPIDKLDWATPLDTGLFEYPLVNEIVIVVEYMGRLHYTRRVNTRNFINNSADFQHEYRFGMQNGITKHTSPGSLRDKSIVSDLWPDTNRYAVPKPHLGNYFKVNNKIRPLKHYEGDTIIQSRFGSSIRFGCYENDPEIDIGTSHGYGESYSDNLGNPMILIRNRQKITKKDEKKFQYNIIENVNEDGSSIQITSGRTISKFVPTINHKYDNVPYRRRGCVHKTYNGLDGISNSNIGTRKDIIDTRNRN